MASDKKEPEKSPRDRAIDDLKKSLVDDLLIDCYVRQSFWNAHYTSGVEIMTDDDEKEYALGFAKSCSDMLYLHRYTILDNCALYHTKETPVVKCSIDTSGPCSAWYWFCEIIVDFSSAQKKMFDNVFGENSAEGAALMVVDGAKVSWSNEENGDSTCAPFSYFDGARLAEDDCIVVDVDPSCNDIYQRFLVLSKAQHLLYEKMTSEKK